MDSVPKHQIKCSVVSDGGPGSVGPVSGPPGSSGIGNLGGGIGVGACCAKLLPIPAVNNTRTKASVDLLTIDFATGKSPLGAMRYAGD